MSGLPAKGDSSRGKDDGDKKRIRKPPNEEQRKKKQRRGKIEKQSIKRNRARNLRLMRHLLKQVLLRILRMLRIRYLIHRPIFHSVMQLQLLYRRLQRKQEIRRKLKHILHSIPHLHMANNTLKDMAHSVVSCMSRTQAENKHHSTFKRMAHSSLNMAHSRLMGIAHGSLDTPHSRLMGITHSSPDMAYNSLDMTCNRAQIIHLASLTPLT